MKRDLLDCSEDPGDLFVLARIPKKNVAIGYHIICLAVQPPKHLYPPTFRITAPRELLRWDVAGTAGTANSNARNVERVFGGEQDRFIRGVRMRSSAFSARDRESSFRRRSHFSYS